MTTPIDLAAELAACETYIPKWKDCCCTACNLVRNYPAVIRRCLAAERECAELRGKLAAVEKFLNEIAQDNSRDPFTELRKLLAPAPSQQE